jgi:UDP-glucose 4-epimerase
MPSNSEFESCFLTGGAGFIGSHMVDRLLAEGKAVTVYDNLSSGRRERIEHNIGQLGFTFIEADLLDVPKLKEAMAGHDLVIHLGANTDIPGGNQDVRLDLENCTIATHNVLDAMRATGIRRLLFASSSAVYGEAPVIPTPEDVGPLLPISLYGAAKLACETLISAYCHIFDMQAWMFRFANVVGGRMGHGVIYDFIHKLKRNSAELEILGDGQQEKPFFPVEDCIDGMFCAFHNSDAWCDVFNLGCSSSSKISRVAEIVVEEMGLSGVRFRYTGGRRGWVGDVPQVGLNVSKMKKLGWEARHTSDEAVRIAARRLLGVTVAAS